MDAINPEKGCKIHRHKQGTNMNRKVVRPWGNVLEDQRSMVLANNIELNRERMMLEYFFG